MLCLRGEDEKVVSESTLKDGSEVCSVSTLKDGWRKKGFAFGNYSDLFLGFASRGTVLLSFLVRTIPISRAVLELCLHIWNRAVS